MPRAQAADGSFHDFPEGTDQGVIDRVMKDYAQTHQPPSFMQGVGTGLLDQLYGMAQLGAHSAIPEQAADPNAGMVPEETTKAVDQAVQQREKTLEQEGYNKGWGRTVGTLLGDAAITAPLMVIPGGAAASTLGRVGSAARMGAAGGAITGALSPTASDNFAGSKAGQVAGGAATGTVLGGALGGIESAVFHFMRPAEDRIAQQATDVVVRRINQDAKTGGPTADDALKAVADWRAKGKPVVLADVGGENVKGLAGNVARQPGESRNIATNVLETRDKAAGERLGQDIAQYISSDPSAYQTTQALLSARSQAARPLYQQAESLQAIWSPRLQSFLENPEVQRGMARGFKMERLEALAENRPFDPTQMGIDLDAEGNILIKKVPNLRVLDMGKRGLDAMIADERDPLTGRMTAMGRSLEMARRAYVAELDDLDTSGVYRAAREAWAGPSASLDALRLGRSVFRRNPEEIATDVSKLSENDREFMRLGVADVLRERIAKVGFGGNEARGVIKNDWMKRQLAPLFRSEQDYDQFVDAVMAEHMMAETRGDVLKGSQTAKRLAEDRSSDLRTVASSMGLAHSTMTGNLWGALRHGAQLWRDLGLRPNEKLNEAVARILFSGDPKFTEAPPPKPSIASRGAAPVGSAATSLLGF